MKGRERVIVHDQMERGTGHPIEEPIPCEANAQPRTRRFVATPLKPFEPVARQGVRNGATFLEDLEEGHQGRRQRGIERRWGLSWTVDVARS